MKGARRRRELSVQRSRLFDLNAWGSDACQVPWPVPLAAGRHRGCQEGSSQQLQPGTRWAQGTWMLQVLGSVSWGLLLIQSRILSSQPSTGGCNFRRNCCASFPMVISWFFSAKRQKPLVSAKVQLSGPGGSDLSSDLGLASPEEPSWGQVLQDRRWDSSVGSFNLLQSGRTGREPQAPQPSARPLCLNTARSC